MKRIWLVLLMFLSLVQVQAQYKFPDYLENIDPTKHLIKVDQLQGGLWTVQDKTDRNNIAIDKRKLSMIVSYDSITERFDGTSVNNTQWQDDNYWTPLIDYLNRSDSKFDPYIKFQPQAVEPSGLEGGAMYFDSTMQQFIVVENGGITRGNLMHELWTRVYNNTGDTIFDGKVVHLSGSINHFGHVDGTVRLAGNSDLDSATVLGIATENIPPNAHGRITKIGYVRDFNTAAFCDNDSARLYLGWNGAIIDTSPPSPYYSVYLGQVIRCDNDSGAIYFNPGLPRFDPAPRMSVSFTDQAYVVDITQNDYAYVTNGSFDAYTRKDIKGITFDGDTATILVAGHYSCELSISFNGTISADTWKIGVFVNGQKIHSQTRSTSSTAVGALPLIVGLDLNVGDHVSIRATSTTSSRDLTFVDVTWEMDYQYDL